MADYPAKDDHAEPAPTLVSDDDQAILDELNERFDYASTQWDPIIREGDIDVRYSAGDVWDEADRAARAGRPVENYDQLSQYTNQLVNSFRQNPRGAKVSPAGGGATDDTAELRANRIRQIEYDSHAQEVYTVAGENMVTRGYGFARIVAEYEDSETTNQIPRLKAIPNPNQVLPDPDGESTSGADWQYLFFIYTMTQREFRREFPDAQIKDFAPETMALAPRWFGKDGRIQIAEYWYVTTVKGKGGRPKSQVCMYLTNGVELLTKPGYPKKTEWKGSTIPFAMAAGQIVYQSDPKSGDSQKMYQSYIRKARSAAKSYSWTKSTELEALALPVKSALLGYQGQVDNDILDLIERSTKEPIAWIGFKPQVDATGQQVLPLPQYGMRAPDIQGYEIAAESFRRDVQNALGRYSAQDHRIGSTKVTSGVALRELDKSGDLGSYHFVAHYDDMIRELAVKLDELLPFYDDTAKEVTTRDERGKTKRVTINTPSIRDPKGNVSYGPKDLRMDPAHRHAITISTGPSSDSQRDQGKDAAMTLLSNPAAFPVVAADSVRLMDLGPIGEQLAKDLESIQPPAMQQARQQREGGGGPNPQQLQQELAQTKQQLQELEGVAQQQQDELKGKQAEIASKEKITQWEIASKERIAAADRAADREVKLAVAEITTKNKDAKLFLDERARVGLQTHEADQAEHDRAHEVGMTAMQQRHAMDLAKQAQLHQAGMAAAGAGVQADEADAQREHDAEMGTQGHQQNMELAEQSAALAPQPDEAGA